MTDRRKSSFLRLWLGSMLWAIPVSAVICILATIVALEISLIGEEPSQAGDGRIASLFSGFFWGLLIFVGFCYIWIPLVGLIIATIRWVRRRRQRWPAS
ncbi:hypothetical protein AAFP30_05715 [Gordonia sp. CPCC 205515]|uniref:hypothetical protein n=1 Tax=Gordonia sp. CPCC 205515 TaxID=3140791 RepID=UPI003AF40AB8